MFAPEVLEPTVDRLAALADGGRALEFAIGTGRVADDGKVTPLSVKVGDSILYGKYSGTELNLEGKDYMIMRESDIYAVLN
jgi:co-chaperonin GroES (HSP10)